SRLGRPLMRRRQQRDHVRTDAGAARVALQALEVFTRPALARRGTQALELVLVALAGRILFGRLLPVGLGCFGATLFVLALQGRLARGLLPFGFRCFGATVFVLALQGRLAHGLLPFGFGCCPGLTLFVLVLQRGLACSR